MVESTLFSDELAPSGDQYEWKVLDQNEVEVVTANNLIEDVAMTEVRHNEQDCAFQDASYVHPDKANSDLCGGCENGATCED